jgi:hypothetical protein
MIGNLWSPTSRVKVIIQISHVVENEVFGDHAALGCHVANFSYFNRTATVWDAAAQQIRNG